MTRSKLEGVKPSKALRELLDFSLSRATTTMDDVGVQQRSPTSAAAHPHNDSPSNAVRQKRLQEVVSTVCCSLPKERAGEVLTNWNKEQMIDGTVTSSNQIKSIPIPVIRAMEAVLDQTGREKLEEALQATSLVFTPSPPQQADPAHEKFRKRMDRLRLQYEESKYNKLTSNMNLIAPKDDVTTKSMTYAASIGLNMIVAPLSFGCFMYFFSGGVFDFFWAKDTSARANGPDIKRIIVGVVSGVIMLFIEMLLFVIRTHEMDEAMRKKAKKKRPEGSFGYYTANTAKTFQE
jgi:hypothetical protein